MRASIVTTLVLILTSVGHSAVAEEQGNFKKARAHYEGGLYYLQYNLFYSDDSADVMNYPESDFLRVGTPVRVKKINDDEMILLPDYEYYDGKLEVDMNEPEPSYFGMLSRLLKSEPPPMEGLTEIDRAGIDSADIRLGMSRRAVFLAVGYPPHEHTKPFTATKASNKNLQADELVYAMGSWDFLHVFFENDVVVAIED